MSGIFQIFGILSFVAAPILVWTNPNSAAGMLLLGAGVYFNIMALLYEIKEKLEKLEK